MGVALYPAFEKKVDGIEPLDMVGKHLAQCSDALDQLAEAAGVKTLMSFHGGSSELLLDLMADEGEEFDLEDLPDHLAIESWFEAKDGLATIEVLLEALDLHSGKLKTANHWIDEDLQALRYDLTFLRDCLLAADQAGVKWHLNFDI